MKEYWMITTRRKDGIHETILIDEHPIAFMTAISDNFTIIFALPITKEQYEQYLDYYGG